MRLLFFHIDEWISVKRGDNINLTKVRFKWLGIFFLAFSDNWSNNILSVFHLYLLYIWHVMNASLLAHMSWTRKWLFLITFCPSDRPSVNFLHFFTSSEPLGPNKPNLTQSFLSLKWTQVYLYKGTHHCSWGDNLKYVVIY